MEYELEQPAIADDFIENETEALSKTNILGGQEYNELDIDSKDISHNPNDEMESNLSKDKSIFQQKSQKRQVEKNSDSGSNKPFGKFDSAESLLKAYNSLQAEFTRKCQAIANQSTESQPRPVDAYNEIKAKVFDFTSAKTLAKKYESELLENVLSESKGDTDTAIKSAYTKLLEKHFVNAETLASSDEFLSNYVYSDNDLMDKILEKYIDKLKAGSAPKVLTRSSGTAISLTPINPPADIKQAGELAKSILKK